jgi:hypothetical protein
MISMYAIAKGKFARRELDWRSTPATVRLVGTEYLPNLETDQVFPDADTAGAVLAALALTNQTCTSSWCAADPMVFVGITLARPCGQAVVSADANNLPLLLIEFPLVAQRAAVDNFTMLFSQRGPGWFRL